MVSSHQSTNFFENPLHKISNLLQWKKQFLSLLFLAITLFYQFTALKPELFSNEIKMYKGNIFVILKNPNPTAALNIYFFFPFFLYFILDLMTGCRLSIMNNFARCEFFKLNKVSGFIILNFVNKLMIMVDVKSFTISLIR